jgi:hypothetical protein
MIFAVMIAGIALFVMYHIDSTIRAKEAERNEEAIKALLESKDEDEIHSQDEKDLSIDPVIRAARQRVHCPTRPPYRNGLHDWTFRSDDKMQCAKCGMLAGDVNTEGGRY